MRRGEVAWLLGSWVRSVDRAAERSNQQAQAAVLTLARAPGTDNGCEGQRVPGPTCQVRAVLAGKDAMVPQRMPSDP
jgi:hypothetical protein